MALWAWGPAPLSPAPLTSPEAGVTGISYCDGTGAPEDLVAQLSSCNEQATELGSTARVSLPA